MKIEQGKYEVLYSGSVIQIANEDIKLTLPDEKDKPVTLVAKFIDNHSTKEPSTVYNVVNSYHLEIIFTNFNDVTGIGNTDIVRLGTSQNREWFFNYRIYSIGLLGKLFHYTFYLGEEVKNV